MFDLVIVGVVSMGAALVIGGLLLIRSGAVTLLSQKGTTTVKIGDFLQLATTVPGLGLFVIGLAFDCVAVYYANQARLTDVSAEIQSAVALERAKHEVRVSGIFQSSSSGDVQISVCIGNKFIVQTNQPFDTTVDPDSSYFIVQVQSLGIDPEYWTLARPGQLDPSYQKFARTLFLKDGVADLGPVRLAAKSVDLDKVSPPLHVPQETPTAGAYQVR